MIAIRLKPTRGAVLACVLALTASGCGLSAELDRELNPERTPTPSETRAAPPPVPATPSSAPSIAVQPVSGCPSSGLRFHAGPVDGAMGLRAMTLSVTNCGEQPYELNGYPSVSVLDEAGDPIPGVRTIEGTEGVPMASDDTGPEPFTLGPGETAEAGLVWRMAAEDGTYLRVAPDKGQDAVNVRPEWPLDIGPENILGTHPWVPAPKSAS
ncbi:DUF4232 domain-containing protein [Streptomyces sp. NPDC058470]|uniref:DUF4232 domain-containing protein n=1 Tax=Streptomyces sp. NPDC058470 TaxID=3346515 RepID=UPI003664093A